MNRQARADFEWRRRARRMRGVALGLLLLSVILLLLSLSPTVSEWYAARVFPVLAGSVGRLLALLPVALFELLLPVAGLWLLLFLVWMLLMQGTAARRRRLRRVLPYELARLGALASCCLLLSVLSAGLLHNRQSFAEKNGLSVAPVEREELLQLAALLGEQAAAAEQVPVQTGRAAKPGRMAGQAMAALAAQSEGLLSGYPRPRATLYLHKFSDTLRQAPVTGEALYARNLPVERAPVEACRALARLSGYRRRGEDLFIAVLACLASEDPAARAGGLTTALQAVLFELELRCTAEELAHVVQQLPLPILPAAQGEHNAELVALLTDHYRNNLALQAFSPIATAPPPVLPTLALNPGELQSPHAIVVDRETLGKVYGKGETLRAHPASLTKMLTASTAIDLMEERISGPDVLLTMTDRDQLGLFEQGASMSGFSVGEQVSYRDLLYTLMLISGCDSGNALAYHLTGSLESFVARMNARAQALGLSQSNFTNPSGLTDETQLTTAADLAVLLADALELPLFRSLFCAKRYAVSPTNIQPDGMPIQSLVFQRLESDFGGATRPNGAVILGGKTGYTRAAGLCLAVLVEFEGRELLFVSMGGGIPSQGNEYYNYHDILKLIDALEPPEDVAVAAAA